MSRVVDRLVRSTPGSGTLLLRRLLGAGARQVRVPAVHGRRGWGGSTTGCVCSRVPGVTWLLVACLAGAGCSKSGAAEFAIEVDVGPVPELARESLPRLRRLYRDWFGAEPMGLRVELVSDAAQRPEYDHFDQERNTIRMGWDREAQQASQLTLAHELAHAFQWALDPLAYEQDPAWIHEGLAEYAVWLDLRSRSSARADAYLLAAARALVDGGQPFGAVFADVYARPFWESYPACHLAVHVLAERPGGRAQLLSYFRTHGEGRPDEALRAQFGLDPAQLEQQVLALAHGLLEED